MAKPEMPTTAAAIAITLVWSPAPRQVFEQELRLPEGATVRDAVAASGWSTRFPAEDWFALAPGIWGRATEWDASVRQGDRIELCRPLRVDPKMARRERFRRQGARATGLFAERRDGGRPAATP